MSSPASASGSLASRAWLGGAGILLLGALWWAVAAGAEVGGMGERFAPLAVLAVLFDLVRHAALWPHVAVSLERVAIGLFTALLVGVPLGIAIGSSRWFDRLTSPSIQFLRMVSPISWMPLAVMVFGVGDRPIWFLLAFAATWPILLATAAGVRALDPRWLELARSLAATRRELLVQVIAPGILASVLTGIRLAIGISWIVLVPAEMLGVNAGLGYYILDSRDRLAYSELMAVILVVGALGFLLDAGARWLCERGAS
ncbi:MAG: ABC transporter permease [Pseudomonadota bacterium]